MSKQSKYWNRVFKGKTIIIKDKKTGKINGLFKCLFFFIDNEEDELDENFFLATRREETSEDCVLKINEPYLDNAIKLARGKEIMAECDEGSLEGRKYIAISF